MVSSPDGYWLGAVVVALGLSAGCSVGVGTGEAIGEVSAPDCGLVKSPYSLDPTFFGGHVAVDGQLEIRVQRGSYLQGKSDGITILVRDPSKVRSELLDRPLTLSRERGSDARMTLYLNETCAVDRDVVPVHYEATSGTVTFSNIYAPELTEGDVETEALFEDVLLVDAERPMERNATISGRFRFLFNRGRPAQRYP